MKYTAEGKFQNEKEAKADLAACAHAGKWRKAKAYISEHKPELTGPAYWDAVRLDFLELGGEWLAQVTAPPVAPVPSPGVCAGRDYTQCVRQHCECYLETGSPLKATPVVKTAEMRPALFLDLDHTLIRPKSGETFPKDANDWEFMPKMLNHLWYDLHKEPRPIVIVTNQGGVAAGFHTKAEIEDKIAVVKSQLITFLEGNFSYKYPTEVYSYVSYDNDYHRKPLPGMAYQAATDLGLDLSKSLMVGDMASDKEFAINAGMHFQHVDGLLGNFAYTPPLRVRQG